MGKYSKPVLHREGIMMRFFPYYVNVYQADGYRHRKAKVTHTVGELEGSRGMADYTAAYNYRLDKTKRLYVIRVTLK